MHRWLPSLLVLAVWLAAASASAEGQRRFALIAGNNHGGAGMRPLHYATDDATRLRDVLLRVGDVRADDAQLLLDGSAVDWRRAFDALDQRMGQASRAGESPVLIVYYSGHAKDGELHLGDTLLPLDEVRERMSRSSAAVRVGIFDACRSGPMNRTKGARKAPAFDVDTGAARAARGLVLLTASAADEDAQESDELNASVFSHHLTSGLLGGADLSGDRRVTLAEAYAYAYERTVADTVGTAAGAQHPTFSYDLAGNGDVVLTQLSRYREGLVLPAEAPTGSYFIIDARGIVAAEIAKGDGAERRVALPPGTYRIKRRLSDRLRIGTVTLEKGQTLTLVEASLHDAPFTDDPVKGLALTPMSHWSLAVEGGYQGFFNTVFPSAPLFGVEANLHDYFRAGFVLNFDLALGGSSAVPLTLPSVVLPYKYSEFTAGASLIKEWSLGSWGPFLGGRLGAILMHRTFDDAGLPAQSYFAMTPGLVAGVRLRLSPRWSVLGRLRLHYLYYNVDRPESLGYLEGAALVSLDL